MIKIHFLIFLLLTLISIVQADQSWLETETVLTFESVSNLNGGIKQQTRNLENLDITCLVDTDEASWWRNGTFFVYFLGNHGSNPTEFIGDIQGSSNIEAYDTFKLYEAWYEHQWGNVSLLAGLHDYNSEFDVLDGASLFFGSSFGTQADISQVGPSIFPTTALAIRAAWSSDEGYFVRAAVYDGIPGDPENQNGTHIILKKEDGLFNVLEIGRKTDSYKIAVGGWYHTTNYTDFSETERSNNSGLYFISENNIGNNSSLFIQLGMAQEDRNEIGSYIGVGWHKNGLIVADDEAGFAIAHARASSDNRKLNQLENAETAFELTYAYTVNKHIAIQPSLQYIMNPSMNPLINNATVLAVRLTLCY